MIMAKDLSVVVITLNVEHCLDACLESVDFAQEIVVVDSGSTDGTLEIAHRYNARVIHQDFLGFGPQKQFAVEQSSHSWVLCIDADERVSGELRESILSEMNRPRFSAYRMPRRNRFMGRWLRHGEGYPDYSLRLFERSKAYWSNDAVHEKVEAECNVGVLRGDLLHESEDGIESYLVKQNRYTTLQAEQLFKKGKKAGIGKLVLSPLLRFIKFYIVRKGLLDGLPGLIHIVIGCFNSFSKYAKLLEKQLKNR